MASADVGGAQQNADQPPLSRFRTHTRLKAASLAAKGGNGERGELRGAYTHKVSRVAALTSFAALTASEKSEDLKGLRESYRKLPGQTGLPFDTNMAPHFSTCIGCVVGTAAGGTEVTQATFKRTLSKGSGTNSKALTKARELYVSEYGGWTKPINGKLPPATHAKIMRLVESDSETTELIAELDAAGYAPDDYMVDLNQAFDISKSLLLAASERKQGARQPQAQLQPQPPPMSQPQPQLALLSLHGIEAGGFYDDPCSSLLALLDSPSVPPLGGGVRPFASLLPTLVEGELPAFNAEAFVAEALNFAPSEARSAARSAHSAAGSATGSARQAAGSALQRLYTEEEMLKSADRARFEGRFEGAFVGEVRAARCLNAQLGAIHAQLGTLVEHVDAGHADLAAHITTGNAGLAAHVTEAAAGVEAQISANNAGLAELITAVEQSSKETLEAVEEAREAVSEAGQAAAEAGQAAAEGTHRRRSPVCSRRPTPSAPACTPWANASRTASQRLPRCCRWLLPTRPASKPSTRPPRNASATSSWPSSRSSTARVRRRPSRGLATTSCSRSWATWGQW